MIMHHNHINGEVAMHLIVPTEGFQILSHTTPGSICILFITLASEKSRGSWNPRICLPWWTAKVFLDKLLFLLKATCTAQLDASTIASWRSFLTHSLQDCRRKIFFPPMPALHMTASKSTPVKFTRHANYIDQQTTKLHCSILSILHCTKLYNAVLRPADTLNIRILVMMFSLSQQSLPVTYQCIFCSSWSKLYTHIF